MGSKLARLLDTASKFTLFSVFGLKDEKLIKGKSALKLKHANAIVEFFENFCQISSKSIHIISSYTISKLGHFLGRNVYLSRNKKPVTRIADRTASQPII